MLGLHVFLEEKVTMPTSLIIASWDWASSIHFMVLQWLDGIQKLINPSLRFPCWGWR